MYIRPENPTEFSSIFDLVQTAFRTANVSSGDEQNFVDRLRASPNYIPELALVAEDNGEIVGHVMLTRMMIDAQDGKSLPILLLAPIAVVLERRKQGIAAALIAEVFRLAKAHGHSIVTLVGDPTFYHRFGFKSAASYGITNTNQIPDEYVMLCELESGALRGVSGSLTYQT